MSTRWLTFPAESVGTLEDITSGRKQPAAGVVEVEIGQPLKLMLERDHAAVLQSLGPDDIQSLFLWGEKTLTPSTIQSVCALTGLRELWAPCKGAWDDQALEALSHLTALRSLGVLRAYGVTDEGFRQLRALTQLRLLRIEQAQITDAALEVLSVMPELSSLTLSHCRSLTNAALRHIAERRDISWLVLSGIPFDDEGLAQLSALGNLRVVFLDATSVTDEGLRHLPPNDPPIRVVGVGRGARSRAQWSQLQEQHPHLDFGDVRELTPDPSIRQRVREHGTPLAGFSVPDDGPLLAIFTSDHCIPCERMLPVIQELGEQWRDRLATVQVHSPDHPDIASALHIMSAPSLVLFTGAERTVRFPGSLVLEELKAELAPYLGLVARCGAARARRHVGAPVPTWCP